MRTELMPEQPALGVDERAAGRAARERRRVLDRAADAAAARAAERAAGRGDEAERRAQAAAAGVGEREHGLAGARRRRRPPGPTRRRARRRCRPRSPRRRGRRRAPATRPSATSPSARRTATSSPRSTCALVSTRPVGDHDAGAAAPAAAEPDHRRADPLGRRGHRRLQLVEEPVIARSFQMVAAGRPGRPPGLGRPRRCLPARPSAGSKSSDLQLASDT